MLNRTAGGHRAWKILSRLFASRMGLASRYGNDLAGQLIEYINSDEDHPSLLVWVEWVHSSVACTLTVSNRFGERIRKPR